MGGGGSQSTGESWSRTTPGFTNELSTVLNRSLTGQSGFSKQDAVADVQGLMRQQAINTMQEALPKIAGSERVAGAYGSTTKAMMNNDLQARIAGQMMATQAQAIKDYAAIDADRIRAFASATQAGTSTAMEHFESSESRNRSPWAGVIDGVVGPVVGGTLDVIAGDESKSKVGTTHSFQNGGRVPKQQKSVWEEAIEMLNLQSVANAVDPSGTQYRKIEQRQQAPLIKPPAHKDEKMQIDPTKVRPKVQPVTNLEEDDELFNLIGYA